MQQVLYPKRHLRISRGQAGFSLVESLVTVLLMSILTLGTMYVAGKATVSQKSMNANNIAVHRMRSITQMASATNCQTSTTASISAVSTINIAVPCSMTSTTYSTITALDSTGAQAIASTSWTGTLPNISTSSSDTTTNSLLGGSISLAPR